MYKFIIPGELTTLNPYINAERSNKYYASQIKKKNTEKVFLAIKNNAKLRNKKFKKVFLKINYFVKNKRKDKDNIAFTKKFIFDGMEKASIIKKDGWNTISGWDEYFQIDKQNPRTEVEIIENI
jgi:hypothetical protein